MVLSPVGDPKCVLEEMKQEFIGSMGGLVTVTRSEFVEFDRALYGLIIVKPSKRLSSIVSVQREIVVIVCNFSRLQVRTVRAVQEIIQMSGGRYESSLAIVVHQDSGGNAQLKNWGREQHITILPVQREALVGAGQQLEAILCQELYSHDPFDLTGPVCSDAQFFGRRTEAQDLARKLQQGQIRSLLGIRKIGKTSIINRVVKELENHESYSIMVDCSSDEIWNMKDFELIAALADAVISCRTGSERYQALARSRTEPVAITDELRRLKSAVLESQLPVIVFFDEIDYLTPASPTSAYWAATFNSFWRNVRVIYQEITRTNARLSVVISGVSSKWFSVSEIDGIENAAMALIPEEYLSPLPRGASVAMVKKVGRTAGLQFDDSSANLVAEESADMPFWIRKAGSFIHRNIPIEDRPTALDQQRCAVLLESFVEKEGATIAELALRHLFRVYPELLEPCLQVSEGAAAAQIKSQKRLGVLERYGIVTTMPKLRLSGRMIARGLELHLEDQKGAPPPNFVSDALDEGHIGTRLGRWADDLAILNRQRNILEKKLRVLALNFIKVDCLQNPGKRSAKERVLAVFEEKRRINYSHLSADEAIEKYCWLDLVTLLTKKEWPLFERWIGDKNGFLLNADVVNDRPDAHAKDIDEADFALYRRSLTQLEGVLAKLE